MNKEAKKLWFAYKKLKENLDDKLYHAQDYYEELSAIASLECLEKLRENFKEFLRENRK